jgi:hypothetical protein
VTTGWLIEILSSSLLYKLLLAWVGMDSRTTRPSFHQVKPVVEPVVEVEESYRRICITSLCLVC